MVIINHRLRLVNFNSIKVRLEQVKGVPPFAINHYFNSIKVRLELLLRLCTIGWSWLFQFHKGAIRTSITLIPSISLPNFNSIKVRLEPLLMVLMYSSPLDFNSIKVRLEHFLFHKLNVYC